MIVALAGGVGGSKLVEGLAHLVSPPEDLVVVVNTADDEEFYGLYVSPDLDTVMYTLAGIVNRDSGWGVEDDTFEALGMLGRYGEETWFRLGDRDLATHILRTRELRQGKSLTEVTAGLTRRLGVRARILPMSDDPVRTIVQTSEGEVAFQEYFVKRRASDPVVGVRFEGVDRARPTPQVLSALREAEMIVVCPSNPIVSIGPILSLPGFREALREAQAVKVAVSPLAAGRAFKGPTVEMMQGLGYEASSFGVISLYCDFLHVALIDESDAELTPRIQELGIRVVVRSIAMRTLEEKVALAKAVLEVASLGRG
ncbi:MAG: 2-phospho-L-lactate transferase [Armatimonadota bacterium]|nr:2-phospho-L-lactate transferase [Armatimonadota bacterium]MDR5702796.1 2-phospho-L-lactate transferase [Armatimonadota bacterium]